MKLIRSNKVIRVGLFLGVGFVCAALVAVPPETASARSTGEVEDALQYGVQTAVNWDTACRNHLNTMRDARFTSSGLGDLRNRGINNGASYVQSTWLSRRGSGNASVPLAVPYGTTEIPLQVNDVLFLCGPLVQRDIAGLPRGCSTSVTAGQLVDDTSRWVLNRGNANDRSPNNFGSGCMYPAMAFNRRKIVDLNIDMGQTTYGGRISQPGSRELLSRRDNSTRYWISTPSSVTYYPQSPITSSGRVVVNMSYRSYSGYHSVNDYQATKNCEASGPKFVQGAWLDIDRCGLQSVPLVIDIVLLSNYTLNPRVGINPTSIAEGVGANIRVSPSVDNTGATATDGAVNWRVTRFEVAPGENYALSSGPAEPCDQVTGEKGGSCRTIKDGSTSFNKGVTGLGVFDNSVDANLPAGTRVCYLTSVEKGSTANPTWKHSSIDCATVRRVPLVHAIGSDVRVGSGFIDTKNTLSKITGSVTVGGGSYGEYGVFAPGAVGGFSSNSGAASGSADAQGVWSRLTFANSSVSSTCALPFGCFGTPTKIPDSAGFLRGSTNSSALQVCDLGNRAIALSQLGTYRCANGQYLNAAQHNLGNFRASVAVVTTGMITIDRDIVTTSDSLAGESQIPQLVLIGGNIDVTEPVKQIDAWLITKGTVDTCNVSATLTSRVCGSQLKINGPIMAGQLQLNRTHYDVSQKSAAEVVNLRPSTYIWADRVVREQGSWQTTYATELPPRY